MNANIYARPKCEGGIGLGDEKVEIETGRAGLADILARQMATIFGKCDAEPYLDDTIQRTEHCFEASSSKYYRDDRNRVFFSPFHSGQYSIFLYLLANTVYRQGGDPSLASKIYYLNKIMNSVDWYYEIELPEYFGVEHPIGSVLGRARYSPGLFIYQGCTVGGNNGHYPKMGRNVVLYANATVIGESTIGDNVAVGTGAIVKDAHIPSNCIVFGQSPNLTIKHRSIDSMIDMMSHFWHR